MPQTTSEAENDADLTTEELDAKRHAEFSVHTSGNPNWVSDAEKSALEELKRHESGIQDHAIFSTDKVRYIFLFARKLDVERTVELMKNHVELREKYGLIKVPNLHLINEAMVRSGFAYSPMGKRDKKGRGIGYIVMNKYKPKEINDPKALLQYTVWVNQKLWTEESLDVFRMGTIYVEDITGVSLSNMDLDKESQAIQKELQHCMPLRIRAILIVEPGMIVKVLISIARLFIRSKIMKRVKLVTCAELHDWVDPDQLHEDFGGTFAWNFEEHINAQFRDEPEPEEPRPAQGSKPSPEEESETPPRS